MNKRTLTLLILLTLIASALWFLGSWWYYTKLKCDCDKTTTDQTSDKTNLTTPLSTPKASSSAIGTVSPDLTPSKTVIDSDGDGLSDTEEKLLGTNPDKSDSDGDGIPDNEELGAELSTPIDTDNDKTIDALDTDDDNDGLTTLIEGEIGTSPLLKDTDGDGLDDAKEVGDIKELKTIDTDNDGTINALDIDDDDDGLNTSSELLLGTNHLLADTDGDGITDQEEIGELINQPADTDLDGIIDALDNQDNTDSDNDGVPDTLEAQLGTNPNKADSDGDGINDIEEIGSDYNKPLDTDENGNINALDTDDDGDSLPTQLESALGTNPLSKDSDDDGIDDAKEIGADTKNPIDSNANGIIDAIDPIDSNLASADDQKSDEVVSQEKVSKTRDTETTSDLNTQADIVDSTDNTNNDESDSKDDITKDSALAAEDEQKSSEVKTPTKDVEAKDIAATDSLGNQTDIAGSTNTVDNKGKGDITKEPVLAAVDDQKPSDTKTLEKESETKDTETTDDLSKQTDIAHTTGDTDSVDSQSKGDITNKSKNQANVVEAESAKDGITYEVTKEADGNTPQSLRLYLPFNSEKPKVTENITEYFTSLSHWVKDNPKRTITITGHTDNIGDAKQNLALGMRRVMIIRELLIEAGTPYQQIDVISRGELQPIADNKTEEGRLKNRRVELNPVSVIKQ